MTKYLRNLLDVRRMIDLIQILFLNKNSDSRVSGVGNIFLTQRYWIRESANSANSESIVDRVRTAEVAEISK